MPLRPMLLLPQLVSLLRPGGMLYLSWRVTPDTDQRDGRGRLYAAFDAAPVREALAGTEIVSTRRR